MSKKIIEQVTESIRSNLSFDDYEVSSKQAKSNTGKTPDNKEIKPEENTEIKEPKKVKRTFLIDENIIEQLDMFYAKKMIQKKKMDKSDIVAQALKNYLLVHG